jgi:hypothetical protein
MPYRVIKEDAKVLRYVSKSIRLIFMYVAIGHFAIKKGSEEIHGSQIQKIKENGEGG